MRFGKQKGRREIRISFGEICISLEEIHKSGREICISEKEIGISLADLCKWKSDLTRNFS